mmetsp:Transcript_6421/g.5517  ORF Transcript_6421/g.5517 Transcript_6421/m.5517 type:complete len:205 (-) Transcript_6421:455-1069(-)
MNVINNNLNKTPWYMNKNNKQALKLQCPTSHFDGYNLWFLKCTQFNRGRGIYVFNNIEQLTDLINELEDGLIKPQVTEIVGQKQDKTKAPTMDTSKAKIKSSTFVIQKYIEKPCLINNRKFDIRVWVLMTHDLKVYFFKEGYLRTSCEEFSLNEKDLNKEYVHLTNNAVQINSENYGKYEDGNQMSFDQFQNYVNSEYPNLLES